MPEPGIRCLTAPVPERALYGEPVERWRGVSPVLGLPYELLEFQQPGSLRTITVKRFLRGIDGYDT